MDQSGSRDVQRTLDIDPDSFSEYWTILEANTSSHAEMVSGSGRTSVLVFGGLLTFWSFFLHATFLWTMIRKHRSADKKSCHNPLIWFLVNSSLDQLAIVGIVLPVELVTEYNGTWTSGRTFCQLWRPIQVGLVALYFWSHFVITVDRYLRCVRPRDRRRRRVTCVTLLASWIVSFASASAVTVVMRRHGAILDDVCALDMSVRMSFLLSFTAYFVPATLTIAASGVLILVTCRLSPQGAASQLCSGHFGASARRLAKSPQTGSTPSLAGGDHCARATLIRSGPDADVRELRTSAMVAIATNAVAILFWMPFYIVNLIVPFCNGVCLDPGLWTMFLWAGYSSVGASPLIWIFKMNVKTKAGDGVD
ncbi:hypothetical protein LSH36_781g01012 [Paralvinella palmiformis]|uniref:G-protein coupled receptors family 1 profile domain-containing protein n=1 Tax=Paralvinella palmiformis TaxID=53620 RepID=A0AAD9J1Z0_9ANNE|nr:hypothetical protein LSH36_781g01012 [Paralvinella palmiformis]